MDWVSGAWGLSLPDPEKAKWELAGEVRRKVSNRFGKGDLLVDMLFGNDDVELWFEHKIRAGLGRYGGKGEYDQLETPEKWLGWKSNARRAFAAETLEVAVAGPGVREVPFEVGSEGERQWAMAKTTDGGKRGQSTRAAAHRDRHLAGGR